jgi:hypothetical protein
MIRRNLPLLGALSLPVSVANRSLQPVLVRQLSRVIFVVIRNSIEALRCQARPPLAVDCAPVGATFNRTRFHDHNVTGKVVNFYVRNRIIRVDFDHRDA